MRWSLPAVALLVGMSCPVSAKLVCNPGRYTLHPAGVRAAALDGLELVLGEGDAAIESACPAVPARDFIVTRGGSGQWAYSVRTRWRRCAGGRSLALRGRLRPGPAYWPGFQ